VKRRVVLINPPSPWLINDREIFPLGILHIASYLRAQALPVEVVDLASTRPDRWSFPAAQIYGIGGCVSHDGVMRDIASRLSEEHPGALIVAGGPHGATVPHHVLTTMPFAAVALGEGEEVMHRLARGASPEHTEGLAVRDKDGIIRTPRPREADIDMLPFPAWDLIDADKYRATISYRDIAIRGAAVITSRGCPYGCAFCASPFIHRRRVRLHSVEYVLGMVRELIKRYRYEGICFLDDIFTLHRRRLLDICRGLHRLDVPWRCLARTDTVDREMLAVMRESGCLQVDFGIESGSQRILDGVGKKVTVEQQKNAVLTAKEVGISPKACIIIGLPGEDDESIHETIAFLKEIDVKCNFGFFVPLPGCQIAANPRRYNFHAKKGIPYDSYLITSSSGYGKVFEKGKTRKFHFFARKVAEALGDNHAYRDVMRKAKRDEERCGAPGEGSFGA
jgi:radical SAM superfamily enzyme YgiQ (UPF0313 family)